MSSCRQSKPAERLSTTLICFRLFPYLDFSRQVTRVPRTSFKSGTLIYVPSPSPPSLSFFLSPHDQVHHPLCELYVHTDRRTKKEGMRICCFSPIGICSSSGIPSLFASSFSSSKNVASADPLTQMCCFIVSQTLPTKRREKKTHLLVVGCAGSIIGPGSTSKRERYNFQVLVCVVVVRSRWIAILPCSISPSDVSAKA